MFSCLCCFFFKKKNSFYFIKSFRTKQFRVRMGKKPNIKAKQSEKKTDFFGQSIVYLFIFFTSYFNSFWLRKLAVAKYFSDRLFYIHRGHHSNRNRTFFYGYFAPSVNFKFMCYETNKQTNKNFFLRSHTLWCHTFTVITFSFFFFFWKWKPGIRVSFASRHR